jgi:hypothetical protein
MTLPGLFALESAERGGELVTIFYPWDRDKTKLKPDRG